MERETLGVGEGRLVNVHNTVGTLVVVALLALTVVNVLRLTGREIAFGRALSGIAALLLLVQYALGFWLLGEGHAYRASHIAFALLALVGVGLEHGYARTRRDPRARAVASLVATALTFVLVLIAHFIGSSR